MSHYKPYPAYKDSGVEWLGSVPVSVVLRCDANAIVPPQYAVGV